MSDLKLDSLRIQNFRTFKDLTIDRLGRVNLIVGKNNVGKTSLLEGIWLWNHPEYWHDVVSFLGTQFPLDGENPERVVVNQRYKALKSEFHGYPSMNKVSGTEIVIGPRGSQKRSLQVSLEMEQSDDFIMTRSKPPPPFLRVISGPWKEVDEWHSSTDDTAVSLSHPEESTIRYSVVEGSMNFVASDGISIQEAGDFWDNAVRKNKKKSVLRALRIILPNLDDVNWINEPSVSTWMSGDTLRLTRSSGERIPMASFPDEEKAVPLSTLGEGVSRALWIGTSVVNSENGIFLIDEIENGLHYSVQPDLWRMIFETAEELDVQVFATTHSFDCIKAFQQAAAQSEAEGRLISLRRREREDEEGEIVAVPYDEDTLDSVVRSNIEVR